MSMYGRIVLDYIAQIERGVRTGRYTDPVEARPFAIWVRQQLDNGVSMAELGLVSESDKRTIGYYLSGQRVVANRSRIEDWLENTDVMWWEIYGADYDDQPLEPDGYCSRCDEVVTPIRSRCPWHGIFTRAIPDSTSHVKATA